MDNPSHESWSQIEILNVIRMILVPYSIIIEKVKMSRIEFEVVGKEVIVKMILTSFQL